MWTFQVTSNGRTVAALATARVGNYVIQNTPVISGFPAGALITTPWLNIRIARRGPFTPAQVRGGRRVSGTPLPGGHAGPCLPGY